MPRQSSFSKLLQSNPELVLEQAQKDLEEVTRNALNVSSFSKTQINSINSIRKSLMEWFEIIYKPQHPLDQRQDPFEDMATTPQYIDALYLVLCAFLSFKGKRSKGKHTHKEDRQKRVTYRTSHSKKDALVLLIRKEANDKGFDSTPFLRGEREDGSTGLAQRLSKFAVKKRK